jgi:hypothetical protein
MAKNTKIFFFLGLIPLIFISSCNQPAQAPLNWKNLDSLKEKIETIERENQIKVVVENFSGIPWWASLFTSYTYLEEKDLKDLDFYLMELKQNLKKYPPGFFEKIGLKKIHLAGDLFRLGKRSGGFTICETGIFINLNDGGSTQDITKADHEIYHVIDLCNNQKNNTVKESDLEWSKLNNSSFTYKNYPDFDENKNISFSKKTFPEPGFVSEYAKALPIEDKAEVFSCQINPGCLNELEKKISGGDKILEKKQEFIKKSLRGFEPEMDDKYWFFLSFYLNNVIDIIFRPESITSLSLDLSGKIFVKNFGPLKHLEKLTNLKTLDFRNLPVQEPPFNISALKNLEVLNLKRTLLKKVPQEIFTLKKLFYLDLSENDISDIPPGIGSLTELKTLYLDGNSFNDLPDEIGNLKGLKIIAINENNELEEKLKKLLPDTDIVH